MFKRYAPCSYIALFLLIPRITIRCNEYVFIRDFVYANYNVFSLSSLPPLSFFIAITIKDNSAFVSLTPPYHWIRFSPSFLTSLFRSSPVHSLGKQWRSGQWPLHKSTCPTRRSIASAFNALDTYRPPTKLTRQENKINDVSSL